MGRRYAVTFEGASVSAQVDFFEVTPAANKPLRILGLMLSQSSDTGDSQEEILRLKVIRGHSTGGSGGSAATPVPLNAADTAAGFAAETLNTTIASAGTGVDLLADAFNIRSGYAFWWTPETAPTVTAAATSLVVRLMAAPADALTMSGTLFVEEIG